ncbi:P-loop containing nucleoside triphosphate hydrolase protein [Cryphonectria parasitica EP155]|uniref:DNA 3'-5' helicase n=1 Tax=Cryphonectria parasitica (strain ATCC 38755 / EP155) TaxID=660469 RepID=A0A9P4YAN4_CRYP1|nr:P-loop containing nucleoside triphosphate hydrolase protein [Cryphonectria parasitica EP155]KAF3769392.1 P-loop containing nucleoside triphosphate hydrolase protein [Cryphonectria parasitica EP155]
MQYSDSWQLICNVFVLDSQVMLVTDCDKMKALCNYGRKVACFLLDQVGRMVVAYIAWLLPGEGMLRHEYKLIELQGKQLEYMWADGDSRRWNTDRLSVLLARVMQAGELVDVGGSWNIVWDLQAMHSTKIARQHYAVHIGFLGRLQPEMVATFRAVSRLWYQFLEGRGEKKERGRIEEVVQLGKKRKSAALEEAKAPAAAERKQAKTTAAARRMDTDAEITAGLRTLLGPEAAWKFSEQAESMRTIMQLGPDGTAICVLPTGAGKSLLFMVPAVLADSGTSIVVVLFVALMEDLVARAVAMSVDCIRADLVSTAEFTAYADGLLLAGLLQRIFVDECHTAITDISYRAQLGELKSLRRFGCPMVLLTATLLPVLESWFREEMLAQDAVAVRARITKANCRYRVELVQGGRGAVQEQTVEIAQQLRREMTGNQKGVVYCRLRQQCTAVAEELGCSFHHSGMSEEERRAACEAWAAGQGPHRWITATTGLGTGVDIEGIVAVVHMELPYGLVDFVQQTGRGGRRAGEVVESVIVYNGQPGRRNEHAGFVEENNQLQMEQFVSITGCWRAVLAAFMDGVGGEGCQDLDGAEQCDQCQKEQGAAAGEDSRRRSRAGGGQIWKAYGLEEGRRVRLLLRWLDEVAGEWLRLGQMEARQQHGCTEEDHKAGEEEEEEEEEEGEEEEGKEEGYREACKRVRFEALACCFQCKLPLDWCEERCEGGQEGRCADLDKVLAVVLAGCRWIWVRILARERFGVDLRDREAFYVWLGRSCWFHGIKRTNALALWEEMASWWLFSAGYVQLGLHQSKKAGLWRGELRRQCKMKDSYEE